MFRAYDNTNAVNVSAENIVDVSMFYVDVFNVLRVFMRVFDVFVGVFHVFS